MVGEHVHSDGSEDEEHHECRGGDLRYTVAPVGVWSLGNGEHPGSESSSLTGGQGEARLRFPAAE